MCYGLLLSALFDDLVTSMQACLGSYPALLLSGILWPVEGMLAWLRAPAAWLPSTAACQAMRDVVMSKGWGVDRAAVRAAWRCRRRGSRPLSFCAWLSFRSGLKEQGGGSSLVKKILNVSAVLLWRAELTTYQSVSYLLVFHLIMRTLDTATIIWEKYRRDFIAV